MTERKSVTVEELRVEPFNLLGQGWMLLASGSFADNDFNAMTVAWGALGTMWQKPLVMVVVRPTRYTYEFMEKYDSFTVSSFPANLKEKLQYCGSHSGRDEDKIAATGLTPENSQQVDAPSFKEANLVLECIKSYYDDFNPQHFIADYIAKQYNNDYHRIYFGEVTAVSATDSYL